MEPELFQLKIGLDPELSRHRLDLLSSLMPTLIQVRSVNLMKIATAMPGPAHKMSRYRRLQRFFSSGVSPDVFTPLILNKVSGT